MNRRNIALTILGLWLVGLALLARRQLTKSAPEQLAEAAVRVEPRAYYYMVLQGDSVVGVASSAIDTSQRRMRATDAFRGRLPMYGAQQQQVDASVAAYLSQTFALDSFAVTVGGAQTPIRVRGYPPPRSGVLLPNLVPVAFMLSGSPHVGRSASYWIYNPVTRDVQRTTLRIAAESVFTVQDSAKYDASLRKWVGAHTDTVQAWSIAPKTSGITAWVDAQGRLVSASEPGGLRLIRTAYEIAFANWRIAQGAALHKRIAKRGSSRAEHHAADRGRS